jgi:hypothetical protein
VLSDSKYNREINNVKSAQSYPQLQAALRATRTTIKARLEAVRAGPEAGNTKKVPGGGRNYDKFPIPPTSAMVKEATQPDQLPTVETVKAATRPIEDVYADIAARIKSGKLDAQKEKEAKAFLDKKGYKY